MTYLFQNRVTPSIIAWQLDYWCWCFLLSGFTGSDLPKRPWLELADGGALGAGLLFHFPYCNVERWPPALHSGIRCLFDCLASVSLKWKNVCYLKNASVQRHFFLLHKYCHGHLLWQALGRWWWAERAWSSPQKLLVCVGVRHGKWYRKDWEKWWLHRWNMVSTGESTTGRAGISFPASSWGVIVG